MSLLVVTFVHMLAELWGAESSDHMISREYHNRSNRHHVIPGEEAAWFRGQREQAAITKIYQDRTVQSCSTNERTVSGDVVPFLSTGLGAFSVLDPLLTCWGVSSETVPLLAGLIFGSIVWLLTHLGTGGEMLSLLLTAAIGTTLTFLRGRSLWPSLYSQVFPLSLE